MSSKNISHSVLNSVSNFNYIDCTVQRTTEWSRRSLTVKTRKIKPAVVQNLMKTGRQLLWSGPRKTDDTVIIIHFVSSPGSFNKVFCDGQSISPTGALISHFPNGERINCQNRSVCISIGIVRWQLIDDQCMPITWLLIQLCANRRQLPIITLFIIGWSL